MKILKVVLFLFLLFSICDAQNLVPNFSFEEYYNCPGKVNLDKQLNIKEWCQPTRGSVDYFNACSDESSAPKNQFGNQQPKSGKAYVGIHVLYYDDYREYLQVKLNELLKANCKYRIQFYVSLSEHSVYAISEIGALFTDDPIYSVSKRSIWVDTFVKSNDTTVYYIERNYKPQVVNPYKFMLKNNSDWMIISGSFWAKGGERYLTIGNFINDFMSRKEKVKEASKGVSYYYIDNVSVFLKECFQKKTKNYLTLDDVDVLKAGQSIVLKNVLFEFDKTEMLPGSNTELDKLVGILKANPNMVIEIGGHTDEKGTVEYNLKLSRDRAKKVTMYLASSRISISRITFKGYGSSRPIATNKTDDGRQLNRRVEFKILKN